MTAGDQEVSDRCQTASISGLILQLMGLQTNNLLRKSPTSPVVEGPPIFISTIAVGPLEDVASWVTGGTAVASPRP
jgi:hypothetical protein